MIPRGPISLSWETSSEPSVNMSLLLTHLAVDDDELTALVEQLYLPAALRWAEDYMDRTVMAVDHTWVLRDFPRGYDEVIWLPRGKTQSISSIEYMVGSEVRTMTGLTSGGSPDSDTVDYQEDLSSEHAGRLMPLSGSCWPSVNCRAISPVVIRFRAGWEREQDVPISIRHAIFFCVDDMLELRGTADLATLQSLANSGKTFDAREALLSPYRLIRKY